MTKQLPKDVLVRAQALLRNFHSRKWRKLIHRPKFKWPVSFVPLGPAVKILYDSDKRDPGMTDEDSRQGIWKPFQHKHIAPHGKDATWVLVPCVSGHKAAIPVDEPACLVFLGYCPGFTFINSNGEDEERTIKGKVSLYSDDRGRMLIACDSKKVHFAWIGPRLEITWRGIVN